MAPLKPFDPTDPSNPSAWGPKSWVPGEDPTLTLPELPSTTLAGLSDAPVKKWTYKDLAPVKPPVNYSDVSQDAQGALPRVGGDQNRLLSEAQGTLDQTDPMAAMLWPQAAALKQAHPGQYDDLTHQQLMDAINAKAAAASQGQGYQPGLADSPMGSSGPAQFNAPPDASLMDFLTGVPSRAEAKGFIGGAANATQSGAGKTALGFLGATGVGAIPAAAAEMEGSLVSSYMDEPNAPKSFGELLGNATEVAAPAVAGNLLGRVPGAVSKLAPQIAKLSPVTRGVGGAAIGGAGGYMTGGVKGAVGGAMAGAGVGLGIGSSPSLKVLKALANAAPEAGGLGEATAAAGEAVAGGLSARDEAALVKRGISPEAIATIKAN